MFKYFLFPEQNNFSDIKPMLTFSPNLHAIKLTINQEFNEHMPMEVEVKL